MLRLICFKLLRKALKILAFLKKLGETNAALQSSFTRFLPKTLNEGIKKKLFKKDAVTGLF